ncbi:hypothetical protein Tdes44962_MAKER00863 [Teratosphaeria destructans]|uniref:Uncharacterized protein n=1 Tax=Teratosphaeria destructans TaxID=418781 RepID=A0A9W7VZ79_9PEZI|nr:hypothetical protein Tdes44962_MAKER00863 [Teratosphaeria destructans]
MKGETGAGGGEKEEEKKSTKANSGAKIGTKPARKIVGGKLVRAVDLPMEALEGGLAEMKRVSEVRDYCLRLLH